MKDVAEVLETVCTFLLLCSVPIIAILVKHQQKMALILRQPAQQSFDNQEVEQLRQEVRELRALMNQQLIATDRLESVVRSLPVNAESIKDRVS